MIDTTLGPYRILERLGAGAMGTVYLAEHEGGRVALKVVHPHLLERPGQFKRFVKEAVAGSRIRHPNVVRTLDGDMVLVNGEPRCYLAMEHVEGKTLRELMEELGPLPEGLLREIAEQVALGLGAIHRAEIVHRDLKPENVLLTADHTVKLMDLGLARIEDGIAASRTGQFLGTILYSAPEKFGGSPPPPDARTDLYSLGVMLYELATGANPFHAANFAAAVERIRDHEPPSLAAERPDLSPLLRDLIARLMARERTDRPRSAEEVLATLAAGESAGAATGRFRAARRPRLGGGAPLRGRERELGLLRKAFARAREGEGRVVLVEGGVGLGKTRLVHELAAELERAGEAHDFLYGSYPPGGAACGFDAFIEAFGEGLSAPRGDAEIRALFPPGMALAAPFASFLSGEPPMLGDERLPRDSLFAAFGQAFAALAERRPTVLLIDDLHFAPPEGLALFAELASAAAGRAALLLGTTREPLPEVWRADVGRLEHVSGVTLAPLPREAIERLLADRGCAAGTASELSARVVERSGGVPFFAIEILRGLVEDGALAEDRSGRLVPAADLGDIRLPESVSRLLQARLAGLAEEDRALLEVASCCGAEFSPDLLAGVLEQPRIRVLRDLARLERRHGLVCSAGRTIAFEPAEIRTIVHESIPRALREEYHLLLADGLERAAEGTPPGALAALVCEHLLAAGALDRAGDRLGAALDHLDHTYRHERAYELARAALDGTFLDEGERIDLRLRAAAQLEPLGRYEEMGRLANAALAAATAAGDTTRRARARTRLGRLHLHRGRLREALEQLEPAVEDAREAGDAELEISARMEVGNCLHGLGRGDEAGRVYEACRALAREQGDRRREAGAIGNLGLLRWERGGLAEARESFEASLAVFRELGDRRAEANATGLLGLVLDELGRHEEAAEMHRRHLEAARDIGYRRGAAIALANLGESCRRLGRLGEARRHHEESGRISREIGDAAGVLTSDLNAATIHLWLGETAEAREHLDLAIRTSREIGARREEGLGMLQLAAVELDAGRPEEAREPADRALALFTEIGFAAGAGAAAVTLGEALLALGREEEARERFGDAARAGRTAENREIEVKAVCWLSRVGGADAAEAEALLREHEAELDLHAQVDAWHSLWRSTGEERLLRTCGERLDALVAAVEPELRDSVRRGLALHREIGDALSAQKEETP